jgi:hypothetical protein
VSRTKGLEHYYAGDKDWREFVAVFSEEWKGCPFQEELLDAVGGAVDLAIVIYYQCGNEYEDCLEFMESKVPALNGISPKECLKTDWGIKRLRECLMRSP